MTTGVSLSRKEGDKWGFPQKVEIKNFYNKNRGEYNLSASGKIMMMTIQRDNGFGSKDVHVSFLQDDGTWSETKKSGCNDKNYYGYGYYEDRTPMKGRWKKLLNIR